MSGSNLAHGSDGESVSRALEVQLYGQVNKGTHLCCPDVSSFGTSGSGLAYSIGTAIVWGVVLLVASLIDPSSTLHTFWLVSLGFFLGWLSATIAGAMYPPPKKY